MSNEATLKCTYDVAWVGSCGVALVSGDRCDKHAAKECWCGEAASRDCGCSERCGATLCPKHQCLKGEGRSQLLNEYRELKARAHE